MPTNVFSSITTAFTSLFGGAIEENVRVLEQPIVADDVKGDSLVSETAVVVIPPSIVEMIEVVIEMEPSLEEVINTVIETPENTENIVVSIEEVEDKVAQNTEEEGYISDDNNSTITTESVASAVEPTGIKAIPKKRTYKPRKPKNSL